MSDRTPTGRNTAAWVACLKALDDLTSPFGEHCVPFAPVERQTKLPRQVVRRAIRGLARAGYAEFHRPLWSDDGPAGAGYCITKSGQEEANAA